MVDLPVRVEVIPTEGLVAHLRKHLPAPGVVTVTCLPQHGPAEAVRVAEALAGAGYTAIPHLAARSVAARAELAGYVRRCLDAGVDDVFVIGGDSADAAGPYAWSGALMEDIGELAGGRLRMGVAAYPEGHPGMGREELAGALRAKQELASWCVTQLCFAPDTLRSFPSELREDGVVLPIWVGVPGPVRLSRLARLAGRIGVGRSIGFVRRSASGTGAPSVARQLVASASYDPAPLMGAIDGAGYAGMHVCSFNDLAALAASASFPRLP